MFKAKRLLTGEVHTVLDVYVEDVHGVTYFLIWENDGWRWRPADSFVPPNYTPKEKV